MRCQRGILLSSCALALASAIAANAADAQSIFDIGARVAPQYHAYTIDSPSNTKISEFSVPFYVLVPVSPSLSFDVGNAYTQARVEQTAPGKTTTSTISGLTDTQIRGNYMLGNDFVVLTAGVYLPTGQSTATTRQLAAASLIGSDFLAFPITNMGTGLAGIGGVAVARPFGEWNLGMGLSMRRSADYTPFEAGTGQPMRYQPGNEYRARVGVDRGVGTGHLTLGLTYSTFGDDNLGGSIYNTGNRYLTQFAYNNTVGLGQLTVVGWNLFRTAGTLADSTFLAHENITDAGAWYGIPVGSTVVEPNLEARTWFQANGVPASLMTTLGVRIQLGVAGYAVLPSLGYSLGRVGAQDPTGANTTATLTGWHAMLAVRLR